MSKLNISRLTNENEDGSPRISGITTFSTTAFLEVPKGTTAQRPEFVQPGMIRFNTDGAHLEYYNGVEWTEVLVANNTLDGGARGLSVGGGIGPTFNNNTIDYITISTLGNAIDFGDTAAISNYRTTALGNSIRAVYGGAYINTIEFVTFSSTGNGTDFGDLILSRTNLSSLANSTRGLFTGGNANSPTFVNNNVIEYITISSTGNTVQFGNLTTSGARGWLASSGSSVRGIFAGGYNQPVSTINVIDYVTISTTGNAIDFGDLTKGTTGFQGGGGSNGTRMLIAGGYYSGPAVSDFTQFITISTLGNAQDFGDIGSSEESRPRGSSCSSTRAVFGGGYGMRTPGNNTNNAMAYHTIATTGNAIDFGDTSTARFNHHMCSNGHGGL